jgi:hypothetical protein
MFSSFNDESHSRNLKYRGFLIVLSGFAVGQAGRTQFVESFPWLVSLAGICGWALLFYGGVVLFRSRQHASKAKAAVDSAVQAPPVVYLRSFAQDSSTVPYVLTGWVPLFEWASVEEQLADASAPIGPLVALGQHNESLPRLGASRVYADGAEWRDVVDRWLGEARLVILRPGRTPGVQWEIARAIERVDPTKLLILLIHVRREFYNSLSASLQAASGIQLPPYSKARRLRGVSAFVAFGESFKPKRLPLKHFWRGPGVKGMQRRFYYAMKPVHATLDVEWVPLEGGVASRVPWFREATRWLTIGRLDSRIMAFGVAFALISGRR